MRADGIGLHKFKGDRTERGCGAVFCGKGSLALMHAEIKERIEPGVKIARPSQAVSGGACGRGVFANMMNNGNRGAGLALQGAEVSKQGSNLPGNIFIDGMHAHQRIEQEQCRFVNVQGRFKPVLMVGAIQAE